tara:strand:+ start:292 stop:462 length:171 start_codon:yes stop_codon:yes gene_type:complete
MKRTRKERNEEAIQRQYKRNLIPHEDQLVLIKGRRGESVKETKRLKAKMEKENATL